MILSNFSSNSFFLNVYTDFSHLNISIFSFSSMILNYKSTLWCGLLFKQTSMNMSAQTLGNLKIKYKVVVVKKTKMHVIL